MTEGSEQPAPTGAVDDQNLKGVALGTQPAVSGNPQVDTPKGSGSDKVGDSKPWYAGLDQDNQTYVKTKGWDKTDKSPVDVLKAYRELETAFSQRSTTEAAPKSPSEYQFVKPASLPEGVSYNEDIAKGFAEAAHKAGLSPKAATAIHDWFIEKSTGAAAGFRTDQVAQVTRDIESSAAELTKAWGSPESPAFQRSAAMAERAVRLLDPGLKDALVSVGVLRNAGGQTMVANATIVAALAKAGQAMFSEDAIHGEPAADRNPFDPKTEDLTAQGRLIKADPNKAALLIQAAGREGDFKSFMSRPR